MRVPTNGCELLCYCGRTRATICSRPCRFAPSIRFLHSFITDIRVDHSLHLVMRPALRVFRPTAHFMQPSSHLPPKHRAHQVTLLNGILLHFLLVSE